MLYEPASVLFVQSLFASLSRKQPPSKIISLDILWNYKQQPFCDKSVKKNYARPYLLLCLIFCEDDREPLLGWFQFVITCKYRCMHNVYSIRGTD
jgi:hypothetical protein